MELTYSCNILLTTCSIIVSNDIRRFYDMVRFLHLRYANHLRNYAVPILASCWMMGLTFGVVVARSVSVEFYSHAATAPNASLFSELIVVMFPIIVSILIMYTGLSWLIPVIAFLKAFCFAYVSQVLVRGFGSASWLMQLLWMFSDCASAPFLWWFWCRSLKSTKFTLTSSSSAMLIAALVIIILDYRFISPILSSLHFS